MELNVTELLGSEYAPVGIWFTDEKPEGAYEFDVSARPCVVSMLVAAAKGCEVVVSDETCPCPGGAVGLGFGNAFERRNAPTPYMLANGVDEPDFPEGAMLPPRMQHGERFFDCTATTRRWIAGMNLSDADYRYVVFRPLTTWEGEPPALVWMLANPDQLSVLVTMCGYRTGRPVNVIAPFGAGCHSIVQAKQQIDAAEPLAIMGMFDISQRHRLPKDLLSLTMPYAMFAQVDADLPRGCMTTHAWETIATR